MLPLYAFLFVHRPGLDAHRFSVRFGRGAVASGGALGLTVSTLPAIPVLVYQLRKTKRALAAGYRLSDLRYALRAWASERRAEIDRAGDGEKRWVRIASRIPLLSALLYMGSASWLLLYNPGPYSLFTAVGVGNLSVSSASRRSRRCQSSVSR